MSQRSTIAGQLQKTTLLVEGMSCASCVAHVSKAAQSAPGVRHCQVNLAQGRATVSFDPDQTSPQQIADAIAAAGYPAKPYVADHAHDEDIRLNRQKRHARGWLIRAIVGLVLWLPVEAGHWLLRFLSDDHAHGPAGGVDRMIWLALATSTIAIVFVGSAFYRSAWKALKNRTSNMDTLIALGASVAYFYSLAALGGHLLVGWKMPELYFMESTGLLALISLGHWLEARARLSAGSAIRQLMELAPATAHKLLDGESRMIEIPVADLRVGDTVLIRPGDRVPIDGVVVAGQSSVDESMISGEAMPVLRRTGDRVIGGTINHEGMLQVRVEKTGPETALAQIIQLVEHAQSSRPAIQHLADRVAAVFVPTVLVIALLTGVGWYAWGQIHDWDAARTWGRIALTVCSVLIIACPCALGLAVPAALMVGTGRGARKGILIRDINALQKAEQIDTVVLDKTGTITMGKPVVTRIDPVDGQDQERILRLAAAAEQFSEHPLARAIVAAARMRGLDIPQADGFSSQPGIGVIAQVEGQNVLVGSGQLVNLQDIQSAAGQTVVHVAVGRNGTIQHLGAIILSDQIKPDSAAAIAELHRLKLRTVLLTGDSEGVARSVAEQVGIDEVRAGVKPDAKAAIIAELQSRHRRRVAMVGDGINDAAALATADLGIAIGSGSDIAKQTSDIVLVSGSLLGVAQAIRLSRATMSKIRQNLFFAFLYNVLAIPLAAIGLLNPYIAAAAMGLSDVSVLGNALLLRRARIG